MPHSPSSMLLEYLIHLDRLSDELLRELESPRIHTPEELESLILKLRNIAMEKSYVGQFVGA